MNQASTIHHWTLNSAWINHEFTFISPLGNQAWTPQPTLTNPWGVGECLVNAWWTPAPMNSEVFVEIDEAMSEQALWIKGWQHRGAKKPTVGWRAGQQRSWWYLGSQLAFSFGGNHIRYFWTFVQFFAVIEGHPWFIRPSSPLKRLSWRCSAAFSIKSKQLGNSFGNTRLMFHELQLKQY